MVAIGGGCLRIPLKVPAYSAATIRLSHWEGSEHEIALHPAPSPLLVGYQSHQSMRQIQKEIQAQILIQPLHYREVVIGNWKEEFSMIK